MPDRTCSIDGCAQQARARGWCSTHYARWHRANGPSPRMRTVCTVEGCERLSEARGMCHRHYSKWRLTGSPTVAPRVRAACSIPDCGGMVYARTWCTRHYQRWLRIGSPTNPSEADRFLAQVDVLESGCWEWSGKRDARMTANYGLWRSTRAHRAAWTFVYGPIPDGMVVMHICDNPPCVNVGHLRLGTQADNIADMITKGRRRR